MAPTDVAAAVRSGGGGRCRQPGRVQDDAHPAGEVRETNCGQINIYFSGLSNFFLFFLVGTPWPELLNLRKCMGG